MSYNLVSFSFESDGMTVHAPLDSPEHVGCGYLSSANLMGSTMNFGGWRFQHPKRGTTAVLVPSNGHNICQRNLKKTVLLESNWSYADKGRRARKSQFLLLGL